MQPDDCVGPSNFNLHHLEGNDCDPCQVTDHHRNHASSMSGLSIMLPKLWEMVSGALGSIFKSHTCPPNVIQALPVTSLCLIEATAASALKTLRAIEGKDEPSEEKRVDQNSERDMQRFVQEHGFSLPVPIRTMEHDCNGNTPDLRLTTYHIRPQDWVQHWIDSCPELLCGKNATYAENFEAFWKLYEVEHPQHEVFSTHRDRLSRVVPLLIHGDEGRAVKKTSYLIVSVETPFGSHDDPRIAGGCSCQSFVDSRADLPSYGDDLNLVDEKYIKIAQKQLTNFKGHSYLSRWLIFGLGGWVYKKHTHIPTALLRELASDMRFLFEQGVVIQTGETVYAALVAIKGDLDFHQKYLNLTRSYSHLGKKNAIQICHLCEAGAQRYPFEDFSECPGWASTMLTARPWNTQQPPALSQINFDPARPELAIGHDAFHVVKVGVGRDVIGGVLIYLLRKGFFDHAGDSTNIEQRFIRAHNSFSLWCQVQGHSPGLRSFTKLFFNMKNLMSAPWCSSKASDTRLLLTWLVFVLRLNIANPTVLGHEQHLKHMCEVCQSTLDINIMHHHGLWLERPCALRLYTCMMTCLRGYAYCGRVGLQHRIRSFIQKPKHHALHHIAYKLKVELLKGAKLISSPQMLACDVNEDFIGRISRLSRRVGFRLCDLRVCQRYYIKIAVMLKKQKRQSLNAKRAFSKSKAKSSFKTKR